MSRPHAFFHRIEGLTLVEGNKTAGFAFVVSTEALAILAKTEVTRERQQRIIEDAKDRLTRAKLLPKSHIKGAGIFFWENTLVPRFFHGDQSFGGSIGANPETFSKLGRENPLEWLGEEVDYTPHNIDTAKMALALVVLAQTWAEHVSADLFLAASAAAKA